MQITGLRFSSYSSKFLVAINEGTPQAENNSLLAGSIGPGEVSHRIQYEIHSSEIYRHPQNKDGSNRVPRSTQVEIIYPDGLNPCINDFQGITPAIIQVSSSSVKAIKQANDHIKGHLSCRNVRFIQIA